MEIKRGFFLRLTAMALAVALPLLALHAYTLVQEFTSASADANAKVTLRAVGDSRQLEALLVRSRDLLSWLVLRAGTAAASRCPGLFADAPRLDPVYSHVTLIGLDGRLLCDSVEPLPSLNYQDVPWFKKSVGNSQVEFTAPAESLLEPGVKLAVLSTQLHDRQGVPTGVLAVSIDLVKLSESLAAGTLRPGEALSVVNSQGTVLVRSPDPRRWIGHQVGDAHVDAAETSPDGVLKARGVDGIRRVFSTTRLPSYGLVVSAGIPVEAVFGDLRAKAVNSAIAAAVVLLFMVGLAAYGASWVSRPIRQINGVIRRRLLEGSTEHLSEQQPGEFRDVVVEFNRLSDLRDEIERDLVSAESRAQRSADFYTALSNVNQSLVRRAPPQAVYEGICAACVASRHARMVWVGTVEDGEVAPVAWGGGAKDYTDGIRRDAASGGATFPESVVGLAVSRGTPCIVNQFQTDPRTADSRDRAAKNGVLSAAFYPFECRGKVVGILALYSDQVGYFDNGLVALLKELTSDISYALNVRANETDRVAAEQAIRRFERQFADIIATAADAIVSVDSDNKIEVFNHAAELLFHTKASTAIGSSMFEFLPEYEKSAKQSTPAGQTVQMTGHRRTDGTYLPLEVSISFAGENGASPSTFVLRDVSIARAQEEQRRARHKAEASSQAKSQFIARMSHELRTPLNAVLGFAQLLQSTARARLTPVELRQLDHIFIAGAQLRALINDVLDASKIEAGTFSVELQDIALHTLLDETLATCESQANAAKIELKAEYRTQGEVVMHTDPLRLRQAILNLISNAIKYNRPGGFVCVDITRSPGHVEIRVDDSGLGMTQLQLAGIFQPFNRAGREHSSIEGTGIGLGICRQLVELLGGALTFESEPEEGTRARLSLPHIDGATLPAAVRASTSAEFSPFAHGTAPFLREENESNDVHGTVLYIEDNPVNALLVEQVLSCWPRLKLVIAEDGADGLAQAHLAKPDLILLDMLLPDMTGMDILARLKSDPATQDIRVVALSASAMNEEVAAALKAGAIEYWLKPIDFQPFLDGLRAFLATEHA